MFQRPWRRLGVRKFIRGDCSLSIDLLILINFTCIIHPWGRGEGDVFLKNIGLNLPCNLTKKINFD